MSVLGEILAAKRASLDALRTDVATVGATSTERRAKGTLEDRLARTDSEPLRLCCEHKRRSPSGGAFDTTLSLAERVSVYARAGATLVSVLTDAPFFGGSWQDVSVARATLTAMGSPALVLAKEFVLDPVQVRAARVYGADAVLLIVRILDDSTLASLLAATAAEGLSALVEVTSESELRRALDCGARSIGVNARDLDTLAIDASRAARVLAAIPDEIRAVHLSGLKREADVVELARGRADGALVGECLMREANPSALLARFVAAARTPRVPGDLPIR